MKLGEIGNGIWAEDTEHKMLQAHGGPTPFEILRLGQPDDAPVIAVYDLKDGDLLSEAAQRALEHTKQALNPNAADLDSENLDVRRAAAEEQRLTVLRDHGSRALLMRDLIAASNIISQIEELKQ